MPTLTIEAADLRHEIAEARELYQIVKGLKDYSLANQILKTVGSLVDTYESSQIRNSHVLAKEAIVDLAQKIGMILFHVLEHHPERERIVDTVSSQILEGIVLSKNEEDV